ncbi:MAG: hypothetical protein Q7T91_00730 [Sulfuricurvum sp.]|nr:hypothetical protein [Sulfuricurvum sp.]
MKLSKVTTLGLSIGAILLLSGCTAKLASEVEIPPAPKVEKMNHELTIENQREIQRKYFEYQDGLVAGLYTAITNKIEKNNYYEELKTKDVDMSHEKMYDCKISQMLGNFPDKYFHNMFVVSNKRKVNHGVSVALNKNDVNDFIVYKTGIYDHKDGGYGIAIVGSNSSLDNVIAVRYKCEKVNNTIFKSDDHRPTYE